MCKENQKDCCSPDQDCCQCDPDKDCCCPKIDFCAPIDCCPQKYNIFHTWALTVSTKNKIHYPKTEDELRNIITKSKKIRVVGTRHTSDGYIQQKSEKGITLISCADLVPKNTWDKVLINDILLGPSIKISAGNTFLDLIKFIRPKGYLMRTQTAGFFFSIGGVIMNPSVHGGTNIEDRLCSLIRSLRIMDFSGKIHEIESEDELYEWRGSLGLLGVVIAAELEILHEDKTFMEVIETTDFTIDKAMEYDATETFYNPYNDIFQILAINYSDGPDFNAKKTETIYDNMVYPNLGKSGALQNPQSSFVQLLKGPIEDKKAFTQLITNFAFDEQKKNWITNYETVRDGYWLDDGVPKFDSLSVFIPIEHAMEAIEAGKSFLKGIILDPDSEWYPNLGLEFRFLFVKKGTLLLDHLYEDGWISIELVNLKDAYYNYEYAPYFMELEKIWISLGGRMHHGKGYAYDIISNKSDKVSPFINESILNDVYTDEVKTLFKSCMKKWDPVGKFSSGAALKLLGVPGAPSFTPHKPPWYKRFKYLIC